MIANIQKRSYKKSFEEHRRQKKYRGCLKGKISTLKNPKNFSQLDPAKKSESSKKTSTNFGFLYINKL